MLRDLAAELAGLVLSGKMRDESDRFGYIAHELLDLVQKETGLPHYFWGGDELFEVPDIPTLTAGNSLLLAFFGEPTEGMMIHVQSLELLEDGLYALYGTCDTPVRTDECFGLYIPRLKILLLRYKGG